VFFLIIVVFLLIAGGLTLIAAQNLSLSVHLTLFSWQTPDLPIGVWLIAAFLLGAIVLYLVSVSSAMHDRRALKTLRQQVLTLEGQISSISAINPSSAGQMVDDRVSTANTGPMAPVPGVNTLQAGGRVPTSPLPPMQQFRQ
jgi:uncharacterized integral membrane protein